MKKFEECRATKLVDKTEELKKIKWDRPSVCVVKISKLTEGFGPRFKDFPLPGLGAAS